MKFESMYSQTSDGGCPVIVRTVGLYLHQRSCFEDEVSGADRRQSLAYDRYQIPDAGQCFADPSFR